MTNMGSNETLFSLELAVESLRINSSTVMCRLPSVAFRLLDFPTLLLHHVDPEEAQNIKEKITLHTFGDIPCQLQELKDHRGNFCINKCKSSLFKMDPQMLLSYLRSTPLYIMLIDIWPEVPKLVANCTVSLQSEMEEISRDIEQNGPDVPSVHSNRDSYKLYNLMGSEVGWIVVRYRMLSIGTSLMPHIPQSEITRRGTETVDLGVTPRKPTGGVHVAASDTKKGNKETDVVLEDLEVQGQPKRISVAVSTIDNQDSNPKPAGLEKKQQATQTIKSQKQSDHKKAAHLFRTEDIIVNNTHCPPPLFFNTANEDVHVGKPVSSDQYGHVQLVSGIDRDAQIFPSGRNAESLLKAECVNDDLSSSSQAQSEDIVRQIETHYKFPLEEQSMASPSWSVRKTHRTLRMEKSHAKVIERQPMERAQSTTESARQEAGFKDSDICNRCRLKLEPNQHSQLPLLEALLHELSLLHGNSLHNRAQTPARTPVKVPVQHAVAKDQEAKKKPVDGKENVHVIPPKVTPQTRPYRHKHRECAKPPQGVPATKGWLRQQRPVPKAKHSTKLHFGMTNSQKLRLQKNNPELLKEMEIQEARMRAYQEEKEKAVVMKNHHATEELDFTDALIQHDISTEIAHHFEENQAAHVQHPRKKLAPRAGSGKSSTSQIKAGEQKRKNDHPDQRTSEIPSPEQPPVPVPQRLKGATYSWVDHSPRHSETEQAEDGRRIDQEPANEGRAEGTDAGDRSRRESRGSVEHKDLSSSEKSARSIDVYLPSTSVHESDSGSNSDDSSDTDSQVSYASSYVKHTKVIQIPGLPSEQDLSLESVDQSNDATNIQYSDDFVGSDNLASTGEQELAPLASTHSDSYRSTVSSLSDTSRSSSVSTAKSQSTQIPGKAPGTSGTRPSGKPANPQTRRLSIPKPKMSSISPVPVRKTSKTSTISINTAVVSPDLPMETKRSPTPPTPKPRPSLLRSASSFSETSLLQSTVPSSEFRTEDSLYGEQWATKEESSKSYSDDFHNSEPISDHSDTF